MTMEAFNPIGTINDMVGDGRKRHGRYSDVLKAERKKLFDDTDIPSEKKRRMTDMIDDTPSANYFSKSSELFRKKYKFGSRFESDIKITFIYLCNQFNVDTDDVLGKCRKIPLPMVRKYVAFFLYYYFQMRHQDIADFLKRERSTITTHIAEAIDDLECYSMSRVRAYAIDKFIHQISKRRKHEI